MPANIHKVKRVLFEISNSNAETYQSDEVLFSKFFNNSITKALEQLFDEFNTINSTISISNIEIDLGVVKKNDLNENLTALIINNLRPQLIKQIEFAQNQLNIDSDKVDNNETDTVNSSIKSESQNEIDILIFFLANGHLPWWANTITNFGNITEKAFIYEIKNTLFKQTDNKWIIRLINQYDFKDLILLLREFVNSSEKSKLNELINFIEKLHHSTIATNNISSKLILRKTFEEIISQNGFIRSVNDFIDEYLSEDSSLKYVFEKYISSFNLNNSENRITEFIKSDIYLNSNADVIKINENVNESSFSKNDFLIIYYLTHSSFPALNYTINLSDFENLITTFIIKNKLKLVDLFKQNVLSETILDNIFLNFSEFQLNKIIEELKDSFSEKIAAIFEIIRESRLKKDLRQFISSLLLNQILEVPESFIIKSFNKVNHNLDENVNRSIKLIIEDGKSELELLSYKIDSNLNTDSNLDSIYFLDLIFYIIEFRDWPWWGSAYNKVFGLVNLNEDYNSELLKILHNFENKHPKAFIDFCTNISKINQASVFLNKLNWTESKYILNKVFPFLKNGFIETLEAILELLFTDLMLEYNAAIITQQYIYNIIDQNKLEQVSFKDFINDILVNISVKLNIPLWKTFNTIKSNYSKLRLKENLTLVDLDYIFTYNESLEDKYLLLRDKIRNVEDEKSNINYFPDSILSNYEDAIFKYINGDYSSLKVFSSNWALGVFILEKIMNSFSFVNNLKMFLKSGNFNHIIKLIQLENLSEQSWILNLLEENESFDFYKEFQNIFQKITNKNLNYFKDVIRAVFLKEKFYINTNITNEKLNLIISNLALYTGVEIIKIQQEIIISISNTDTFSDIFKKNYVNYNNNLIFENSYNLNIKNFKRDINNLLNILDSNSLLNFTSNKSFDVFNDKNNLVQWIKSQVNYTNKNVLIDYFINLNDPILFNYYKNVLIGNIKERLLFINNAAVNNSTSFNYANYIADIWIVYDKSDVKILISLFYLFRDFNNKNDLLEWLYDCNDFKSRKDFISFIENSDNSELFYRIKESLISLVENEIDYSKIDNLLKDLKVEFSDFFKKLLNEQSFKQHNFKWSADFNLEDILVSSNIYKLINNINESDVRRKIEEFINSFLKKIDAFFLLIEPFKNLDELKFNGWSRQLNFAENNTILDKDLKLLFDFKLLDSSKQDILISEIDVKYTEDLQQNQDVLLNDLAIFENSIQEIAGYNSEKIVFSSNNYLWIINKLIETTQYLNNLHIYYSRIILIDEDSNSNQINASMLNYLHSSLNSLIKRLVDFKILLISKDSDRKVFDYQTILYFIKNTNEIEIRYNQLSNIFVFEKPHIFKFDESINKDDNNPFISILTIDELELSFNTLHYQFVDLQEKIFANIILNETEINYSIQVILIKLEDLYQKVNDLYLEFINRSTKKEIYYKLILERFIFILIQLKSTKLKIVDYRIVISYHLSNNLPLNQKIDSSVDAINIIDSESFSLTNNYNLSNENICDIVIYFILYREIPWWSTIKELTILESLLISLLNKEPVFFKKRLKQGLKFNTDYIDDLILELKKISDNDPEAILSSEDIDKLLKEDLDYLFLLFDNNLSIIFLKSIVKQVIVSIKTANLNEKQILDIFRKSIIQIVINDQNLHFILERNKNQIKIEWLTIYEKVLLENKINTKSGQKLFSFLLKIEGKFNSIGINNGISITNNINSLYRIKNQLTLFDVFNSWLFMLESFTGVNSKLVKDEINTEIEYLPEIQKNSIHNQLQELLIQDSDNKVFIAMPFTNILIALTKVVNMMVDISSEVKIFSLKLFTQLLFVEEFNNNPSIPFSIFFNYLSDNNLTKPQFLQLVNQSIKNELDENIKINLLKLEDLANGKFLDTTYLIEIDQSQNNNVKNTTLIDNQIDKLINLFQTKNTVFEKMAQSKKWLTPFITETKIQEKKIIKKRFNIKQEDRIYVPNAGLILLWPFLTRIFANLKYIQDGLFINDEKRLRAIFLTQYLVGFTEDNPEYTLMLNKLLCGLDINEPILEVIILTDEEKMEAENLIKSVLVLWKEMSNTSVTNFQRTFIQREGVIFQKNGDWNIMVNHSAFDIILLKLPWGLSIIKYPWNNYLIFVEWKAMS